MIRFFVETVHGVLIDSVDTITAALRIAKGGDNFPFRIVPARVYFLRGKGEKVYVKNTQEGGH